MRFGKITFRLSSVFILLAGSLVLFALTAEGIAAAPGGSETLSVPLSDTAVIFSDSLTLLAPNGGEMVASGSTYTVSWAAPSSAVKFKLKYSMDNGVTWYLMDKNITGTSYNWVVPPLPKNKKKCLVKVIGFAATGGRVGADKSDSTFTIEVVRLTSPDGGEVMSSGATQTITWATNETIAIVSTVNLLYTRNGGVTWKPIETITGGNPGTYTWTVPNVSHSKTKCKVKVVLRDSGGIKIGSDASDGYFTISPAQAITTYALTVSKSGTGSGTVTSSPAGISCGADCAESYASGTTVTLTATAAAGSTFAGWSGACGGTGTCTATMSQARNVTATFNTSSQTVTLNPQYDNMVMKMSYGRCSTNNNTICTSDFDCQLLLGSGVCQFAEENLVYQNATLPVGCNWVYDINFGSQQFTCFQSLVRFNTSSLAGKTIDSATLKLVTSSCGVGYYPRQWHVRAMYTTWSPTTVTWNIVESSQYWTASEIILYPPCYYGQSQIFEIDLTNTVKNWASGAWNNYGLIFGSHDYTFPYNTSFDAFEFFSLEDPGQDWPKLTVTYH